ncbi:MAG: long-chain fatty acid--CoA ligase [Chitinophagales bacterium]
MEISRLFDYLTQQVEERPNQKFLAGKITEGGHKIWKHYTFQEVQIISDRVAQALLNLGVQPGDMIGLSALNCPEWNFIDLGVQKIGAILVPLYPTASTNDFRFIFNDAQIKIAFMGDEMLYRKTVSIQPDVPSLRAIYSFNEVNGAPNWKTILPEADAVNYEVLNQRKAAVQELDMATIIYTSGTTGNPKGVMLTHKNMVSNLKMTDSILPFEEDRRSLSFLPLCHVFERIVFFAYLKNAIHIHYAENLETIGENLKEVKPFVFTTVPRLLEKVYERIMNTGHALTGIKKKLFFWAMEVGNHYELNKDQGLVYRTKLNIARKLIFSKWQEALGGEVKFIVTGAAPLQARLGRIFSAAGIAVIEGYGLSESSPGLCLNRYEEKDRMIGTVGLPLPGVDIKLAEDGEILAKGPNIMKGYYNRPDLTAEVIDSDGYLHTGDVGEWVDGRFLRITDRKKELFKTSGGKYVAPAPIENKLKESHFIEQVMLVGDNQKFVTALVVPSFANLQAWAKENEVPYETNRQIVDNEKVKHLIYKDIEQFNQQLGNVERVKKFTLLEKEWTIEEGELTPTLKVKRKTILTRYQREVEQMYAD